ncbi:MAG TPA: hypothetical protein PLV85_19110, partial [Polyangiaceae bacterium]|nr:hypothetical protein [Polyangiaceae bacterium]
EKTYAPAVRRLLSWFPDLTHAVDMANAVKFAFALRKADASRVPQELLPVYAKLQNVPRQILPELRSHAPGVFDALVHGKNECFRKLHRVIGRALGANQSALILSAEHNLGLETSRFDAMFAAAIDAALFHCAASWPGETRLHVIYEEGGGGHNSASLPEGKKVKNRWGEAVLVGKPCAHSKTDAVTGLFFSDVVLHALGPQKRQNVPCSKGERQAWSLTRLRQKIEREFCGVPSHLRVVDGLHSTDVLDHLQSGSSSHTALRDTLNRYEHSLPDGMLPAAIETSFAFLDASKDLAP